MGEERCFYNNPEWREIGASAKKLYDDWEEIQSLVKPEGSDEIYPPFLNKQIARKGGEETPLRKITDCTELVLVIWSMANKNYQERLWGDSFARVYKGRREILSNEAKIILDRSDSTIEVTEREREMVQQLLDMLDAFENDPRTPLRNDIAVASTPQWDKVRNHAKLVYKEITKESADVWWGNPRFLGTHMLINPHNAPLMSSTM